MDWSGSERASGVGFFFQKTFILVFEVILQPPTKHTFQITLFPEFQLIVHYQILQLLNCCSLRSLPLLLLSNVMKLCFKLSATYFL